MNPRRFQHFAEDLLQNDGPAEFRSAISRAYYAAFHVAAEALRQMGFPVSKGGAAHGEVARCLMNATDPPTVAAGTNLADLHTYRLRADYHLERVDVEQLRTAQRAVSNAKGIIETTEKISTSPHRSQIQSAIAAWRKSNGYP